MGQAEGREGLIRARHRPSAPACTGAHAPTCVYTLTHGGMGWEAHLGHGAQPAQRVQTFEGHPPPGICATEPLDDLTCPMCVTTRAGA